MPKKRSTYTEPRPTEKARATRAALIDSASTAFTRDGYGATSVRDLAEELDLTSGAIYGHFKSKANLLGEVVSLHITRDLEQRGGQQYEETALADYLEHNFHDYPRRTALRALVVEAAEQAGADVPLARAVAGRLREGAEAGLGDEDMAATYRLSRAGPG